jgi:hypothetical protein
MFDQEIEAFKREIDLPAFAVSRGYQLDRRESWKGSAVLRHPNGDKIVVKRGTDGHYVYFSVRDDRDNGSIIDFVQNRERVSIGVVRKILRPWIGMPPAPIRDFSPLQKTSKDRMRVETEFAKMQDALLHPYLENERALPASLLQSERFAGRIRMDTRGNAVFPHFDADGICGFEIKNKGFTGFSSGGTKGLWLSHEKIDDNRFVLAESAIDALSHAVLFPDDRARYASIGGKLNPTQPELIRSAIARMPHKSNIVAAMDADADGAKLADAVRSAFNLTGRDDLRFLVQEPFGNKDWNDQLMSNPRRLPSSRPKEPSVA